ncbi:MAG: hypothetical protein IJ137_02245 [Eubacterium sp.]|nr:hypothetical protein [Eubacterium sp.]
MATAIHESSECTTFQTGLMPRMQRIGKLDYAIFDGDYENHAFDIHFDFRVKYNYLKKQSGDVIKNDHIILQNQRSAFFLLFEIKNPQFKEQEDGSRTFEEKGHSSHYDYTISVTRKVSAAPTKADPRQLIKDGNVTEGLNAMLQQHGLNIEVEGESAVADYMKSWKLGHPDEN